MSESRDFKDHIYQQLARIGKAISSPKRLEILDVLAQGTKTVETMAKETGMSIANTSQHLQTLHEARLVEYQKKGLYSYYRLADMTVTNLILSLQLLAEKRLTEIQRIRDDFYLNRDSIEPIHIEQLMNKLDHENIVLIDVRPKEEYELMHIPNAVSFPIEELEEQLNNLPKDREIVAYCRGKYCLLSLQAVELLRAHGYHAVRLEEGVQEWNAIKS